MNERVKLDFIQSLPAKKPMAGPDLDRNQPGLKTVEFGIRGMDCTECTIHVKNALDALNGVEDSNVFLNSEKAVVKFDPLQVGLPDMRKAVEKAGYTVPVSTQTIEVPIKGMDCVDCTVHIKKALSALNGVEEVNVFLTAQKAVLRLDQSLVGMNAIRKAVEEAGYSVPAAQETATTTEEGHSSTPAPAASLGNFTRPILTLFSLVIGAVLLVVVAGEWLGLFEAVTNWIPWPLGVALVLLLGYPIFKSVVRATLQRRVISHTLMSLGALAALAVGEWPTAVIVVFFMRVGEYAESFTTERSRRAVKNLTAMAPRTARIEREDGKEEEVPVGQVQVGDIVVVRPGEKIPVDGTVLSGQATVDQAAITGESLPVEVGAQAQVFAATIARLGSLRVRANRVGSDTTFGRVIRMVEEAEAHRADVQRVADSFSAYFLPVVIVIAAVSFIIRRDPLSTAAVLVVACSCSFALATPIAMLASIGAAAKRGLLIKGGKYLEALANADVLLIDKTGTLTTGRPRLSDIVSLKGSSEEEILGLAAVVERYSEHPLAEAVRGAATERKLSLSDYVLSDFEAVPGMGVRARVNGAKVIVGNYRMLAGLAIPIEAAKLEEEGKTLLYLVEDGKLAGILAATDTVRPEIPAALAELRAQGIKQIELLTGDNERTASTLAGTLGIRYRANLLPEEKIAIVKEYQARGHRVVMVGDGVNDAPALAQANVGIAMGVAGTDVAVDAAHLVVMREDWQLVPEAFAIAKRTMRVVKVNIVFTLLYNLVGLSLAAVGLLPPAVAAAAQSVPDLGILANSSRLLRYKAQNRKLDSPES